MTLTRRATLALPFLAAPALAQARPVRLLVGFAPGGAADTIARLVSARMGEHLGQTVVVENRSGASGTIAAAQVAQSAPDGTSLLFATLTHATNPFLFQGLPFDYATAFAPVSQVVIWPQILAVKNDFPAQSFAEFLALARARPATISYGTPGNATAQHLIGEMLQRQADIRLVHVPYRGGADAARDLSAGVIDAAFMTTSTALPILSGNRARLLAAATTTRLRAYPNTATIAESGIPGFELNDWCAIFAPAGTATATLTRTHAALTHALANPDVQTRLRDLSTEPVGSTPEAFTQHLARESTRLGTLIRDANIRIG
ncbi:MULTISPECIES: Bug family tripartite tricarboxylate transporter substrate binding protein [Roseomonadaceae]|uniref:Tripartite tricarboxylate transporter substrate binding protein n=1 Tax=Falsiroseomonas oleicola TaxID=2801474 RepID=A0ABS6H545_9PROT|nr:tripartite tricarboxylate transporter substrate binding protein [Roseomonas oleicola]MBU8543810.1 tripartite tricarboxylate transporter substrate binding protein [Roseomonas oleicola]